MPILKKPNGGQPSKPAQQQPAKGGKASDPFAKKYAETDAQEGSGWVPPPPGQYNCLITEGQGVQDGDKTSAYLEFVICDEEPEAAHGKTARIYWNFTDENGDDMPGMAYFKSAMTMLGHDEQFGSWDEMCEALAAIAGEEMWVIIDVKKKGKYTNCYLSSVPEDQSQKPANPNE